MILESIKHKEAFQSKSLARLTIGRLFYFYCFTNMNNPYIGLITDTWKHNTSLKKNGRVRRHQNLLTHPSEIISSVPAKVGTYNFKKPENA